jgi:hypothetical protein
MLRMRMTDQGCLARLAFFGFFEQRLETAGGSVHEERFDAAGHQLVR